MLLEIAVALMGSTMVTMAITKYMHISLLKRLEKMEKEHREALLKISINAIRQEYLKYKSRKT